MKNPDRFEQRFGFVAVFDTRKQKRRPLAKHLANDLKFMEKHGFILLEKPEPPSEYKVESGTNIFEMIENAGGKLIPEAIVPEKKKRGRPKKQK